MPQVFSLSFGVSPLKSFESRLQAAVCAFDTIRLKAGLKTFTAFKVSSLATSTTLVSVLNLLELRCGLTLFIKAVQRVASRRQAVARRGRAIAEGAAEPFTGERSPLNYVKRQFRVRQNHAPQP